MTTLRDVARSAGVSVPTASRVINNREHVRESTRAKVLEAIEKLSYHPNILARDLKQGKTRTIGFILPDISNSFFGMVAVGIEKVLRKNGYHLILCNTDGDDDLEIDSLSLVISKKVRGIILATVGPTVGLMKRITDYHKIPIVAVDNKIRGFRTDAVLHNNIGGVQQLTSHLLTHGHKRIAFIGGPIHQTSGKGRLEGYKKALVKSDFPILEDLIKIGDWKKESGFRLTRDLLRLPRKPTGIVAANTFMALGVLRALGEAGLEVPGDVALVSFDDLEFASFLNPSLTTLKSLDTKIGEVAASLLLKRIKKRTGGEIKEIYLPTELVIRRSCGC